MLRQTIPAIHALTMREVATTHGRAAGGYLWSIIEPAAGITLLTLIFSVGFRAPPLGTSFALYYATGLLPLLMYLDLSTKLAQTVQFSRTLFSYPRVTVVDALLARLLLSLLTQLLVHAIVFAVIFLWLSPDTALDPARIAQAYLGLICLAAGIGTLNSFVTVVFPPWASLWAVLNRPLFLLSCIFFNFESVPQPYRDMLWYNPLVHIVGRMRYGFYPYYQPSYATLLYPVSIGAVAAILGLLLLRRFRADLAEQ
jgi:capsular polysaccharide transport system permease protein